PCEYCYMLCGFVISVVYIFFFFFFQAEDGIRDATVTGVQTCALPILEPGELCMVHDEPEEFAGVDVAVLPLIIAALHFEECLVRSEERRVGKECRSWWGQ